MISLSVFCFEYHNFLFPLVLETYNLNSSAYKLFVPVLLFVLIIHIIIAIQRMIIKILSAVINSIRRGRIRHRGLPCRQGIVLGQQIHAHTDTLPLDVFG